LNAFKGKKTLNILIKKSKALNTFFIKVIFIGDFLGGSDFSGTDSTVFTLLFVCNSGESGGALVAEPLLPEILFFLLGGPSL
jgi:hypothetical protein